MFFKGSCLRTVPSILLRKIPIEKWGCRFVEGGPCFTLFTECCSVPGSVMTWEAVLGKDVNPRMTQPSVILETDIRKKCAA